MSRELSRRAVLGAIIGVGVGGAYLSPVREPLEQFAPVSGSVWRSARATRQERVESPYGPATVRFDDDGVPHVSADDEEALYFAVGYTQATDRLFQMDLQRRLFRGELAAVVGEDLVSTDRFHRQMAFSEAAEVTAQNLDGTAVAPVLDAYAEGVNEAIENETLSVGFQLLNYEPEPWTRADTALIEKIITWQLTGSFRTLRVSLLRERFRELFSLDRGDELADELFPGRFDHDAPIIRDHHDAGEFRLAAEDEETAENRQKPSTQLSNQQTVGKSLVDWTSQFEPPRGFGSNSWVIGTEHAAGDAPILANDPHLGLQAPPTWYEMHLDGPNHRARGVTFPGAPIVTIGENDYGAWGFTNAGADVIDFYRYDDDGETYQYGDEQREFERRTEEIEVSGGPNREVEVRKTVHGPVIEEAEQEVGVAWTGHTATESMLSLYQLSHSEGMDDVLDAVEQFEAPTQNLLYADRDGNTLYFMTGRVPLRRTDGELVRGDQVFDGSAREGEWEGFEPFGESSWEGFVPLSANPQVVNPEYLSTANQQIVPDDQLEYYLAEGYASPYRGQRIYDLLDQRIASGQSIDLDYLQELGRDSFDGRAAELVDDLVSAARGTDDGRLEEAADKLADWDYRLDSDSRAALIFTEWLDNYREETLGDAYEEADLGSSYYPADAAIVQLGPDSVWFASRGRARVMRIALDRTLDDLEESEAEVYGDVNHTGHINHLTELDFLGYPAHQRGGSGQTVWNYSRGGPWGGSWEMQADLDGDLIGILPGGNSGRYFSEHYDDQIEAWANGEYRTLSREIEGALAVEFVEGDQ